MKKFNAHTMLLINIGISTLILILGGVGMTVVAKQKDVQQLKEYEAVIQRYEDEKEQYKHLTETLENQVENLEEMITLLESDLQNVQIDLQEINTETKKR